MEQDLNKAAIDALVAQMNIEEGNRTHDMENALTKGINMLIARLQEREEQLEILRKTIDALKEQLTVKDTQISLLIELIDKKKDDNGRSIF